MKSYTLVLFVLFNLISSIGFAQPANITFTGYAENDFNSVNCNCVPQVSLSDGYPEVGALDGCGPASGFDFKHVYMYLDPMMDRLYIGVSFAGFVGDADGNGNALTSACSYVETPNNLAGMFEVIGIIFNNDTTLLSGNSTARPDFFVGWPRSDSAKYSFGIYSYRPTSSATTSPSILYSLDTPAIVGPIAVYPFEHDTTKPDMEFYIDHFSLLDPDYNFSFRGYSDANGGGEDNFVGKFVFQIPLKNDNCNLSGIALNDRIILHWKEIVDDDLNRILLERSLDGQHFAIIDDQTPQIGSNQYVDKITTPNKYYYRLVGQKNSGRMVISNIVSFNMLSGHNDKPYRIFPNPSKGIFQIMGNFTNETTITLHDLLGHIIPCKVAFNNGIGRVETGALPAGVYTLQIRNRDTREEYSITIE